MQATSPPAVELKKIRSEALRREAIETDSTPRVVVVEVNLPRPRVERRSQDAAHLGIRWQIQEGSADTAETDRQIADMRKAIKRITGKPPERFFSSSGAFVVTANGKQLQELAKLPAVSAIWPNDPRERGGAPFESAANGRRVPTCRSRRTSTASSIRRPPR